MANRLSPLRKRRTGQAIRRANRSGPRPTPSRRYQQQGNRKQKILAAAARLYRERGFENTTLDDVARALKVTNPTLYYHVGNKEEILKAIQSQGFTPLQEQLTELLRSGRRGADILEAFMARYCEWITTGFGVCVVRLFGVQLSPENTERVKRPWRLVAKQVVELLEHGIADGSIKRCDARVAANALFGAFNWLPF